MSLLECAQAARQNHGVEHATVQVLSRINPYVRIMGRSTNAGFFIYGALSTQDVANAATEALVRLQQGEAHLSIHPRCGTNLTVTGVLCGLAAYSMTLGRPRSRFERLPLALTAATLAAVAARPLGQWVQETITTTPDVDGLYIESVTRQQRGGYTVHKVAIGRE
jgi:hypothetical protein